MPTTYSIGSHTLFSFDIKPGVCPVLYGSTQGTGKDVLGRVVGHLLQTPYYRHLNNAKQLTDAYGGATLLYTLFIHAEEVLIEGGKADLDILKSVITAPQLTIRFMRTDPFQARSFARVYLTSNHPQPVHIEPSDRRFVPIEVLEHLHTKDSEWFGRLLDELAKGGYGRLMFDLQARDLTSFDVRRRLETAEHNGLRTASMPLVHQFVAEIVSEGAKHDWSCTDTLKLFIDWCSARKKRAPEDNQVTFGRALKELKVERYRGAGSKRPWTYRFSKPQECRAELIRLYPDITLAYDFGMVDVSEPAEAAKAAENVLDVPRSRTASGTG